MTLKELLDRRDRTGQPSIMLAIAALTHSWLKLSEMEQAAEIAEAINAGYSRDCDIITIAMILQGK